MNLHTNASVVARNCSLLRFGRIGAKCAGWLELESSAQQAERTSLPGGLPAGLKHRCQGGFLSIHYKGRSMSDPRVTTWERDETLFLAEGKAEHFMKCYKFSFSNYAFFLQSFLHLYYCTHQNASSSH